ncbi:hypothetical protein ACTXT7_010024 [Hymenolepis weldensis]
MHPHKHQILPHGSNSPRNGGNHNHHLKKACSLFRVQIESVMEAEAIKPQLILPEFVFFQEILTLILITRTQ